MWLHGSAGAGKSAVAQTMAQEFRAGSNLAASFFFSRTAPSSSHRGHEGRFVTTIAYQLTEVVPGLHRYVEQVVLSRPSVFDLTLTEQVTALIMDPLRKLQLEMASTACVLPKVIVVDGLDECKEESGQVQVLEAIATLISHQDVFPCSVFLASRPELVIRSWITTKQSDHSQLIRSISLLDHCDGDHDIEVFVKDEAVEIRRTHPLKHLIPYGWPSPEFVKAIVERACGQFIYASIVMKYIKDLRGHPSERLEAILHRNIPTYDQPYSELDALYLHILRQTKHPILVHRVLAFRIATETFVGDFHGIDTSNFPQNFLSLPLSVHTLLIDLQSIINYNVEGMRFMGNPKNRRSCPYIFHHASFLEFLLDPHRSEEFHVDPLRVDKELYEIALRHLSDSSPAISDARYIVYCFLVLLQTRTSHHPSYRDRVITQLARWDNLNEDVLYATLNMLSGKCFEMEHADKLVDIIDRNLWTTFAPAVTRTRARFYQQFEAAGLPQELAVMYCRGLIRHTHPDLPAEVPFHAEVQQSFRWHIRDCIQQRTGVDPCTFFSLQEHQFLLRYDETTWHIFMHVLEKYLPASEREVLQIDTLQQNALSEWRTLAPAVAVFEIKHLVSMLETDSEIASDYVKETAGINWRAITACVLLRKIGHFIWKHCPISTDIVSALEEISQKFFPSHLVSTMEDTTFLFDF
ncbi:hypothetical protein BJ165DRAFT_1390688, partial [Panaeolus papilionaceus]